MITPPVRAVARAGGPFVISDEFTRDIAAGRLGGRAVL
jgi:hypothetical protein